MGTSLTNFENKKIAIAGKIIDAIPIIEKIETERADEANKYRKKDAIVHVLQMCQRYLKINNVILHLNALKIIHLN